MVFSNEEQLIARLKAGQQRSVEEWYRTSSTRLRAFFVHKVADSRDADELMHDTFLSCIKSLPLFRGTSGLWGYMLSIARHELADYWRKRYAKKLVRYLPYGQELLDTLASDPTEEDSKLEGLPESLQELLALKYVDGYSLKELANHFGVSVTAIQSRLHRAKKLAQLLITQEDYDELS